MPSDSEPAVMPDWLAHSAAVAPGRAALVANGRTWTFSALDAEVAELARRLVALGAGPRCRVATLAHGATAAKLIHAAPRAEATLVPLNTRLSELELEWQLTDAGAQLLVTDALHAARAAQLRQRIPSLEVATAGDEHDTPAPPLACLPAVNVPLRNAHPAEHVHSIIYTSGTTGRPRGAMLTISNLWWSAVGSALRLGTSRDDRWLATLPLFHVGGLSIVTRGAICGITVVAHDGFEAGAVSRALDEDGITLVSFVPTMLQRVLDARGNRPFRATLRCVLLGGGPTPRSLLERCAALGVPVATTYGLTETTSQLATLAPEDALHRPGSSGKPLYPNEVRIEASPSDAGSAEGAGEILVRGPVVMAGYVNQMEATARVLDGGWLHTGDLGRLDEDGYLHVLDRRDDLVVTGGENVYPAEVEAVLLAHPGVAEAAVIGAPDERWGQRVVAVVRLHSADTVDVEALSAFCRARIASYKVPREVRFVATPLPRTASGKLQRSAVRRLTCS